MNYLIGRITTLRSAFKVNSLFRNATYLMASTVVAAILGFAFWIVVAHVYSPANIGIASALIAITTLLSNISLLGLNAGLVRFLPKSTNQSRDINAATLIVAIITLAATAIYVTIVSRFGGGGVLLNAPWHKLAFIILMITVSLNSITDAVFIANRRGEYHTLGYGAFGLVKLVLPLFLIPFGAIGIFGAYIVAMLISLILSYYLMWRGCNYTFFAKPNFNFYTHTRRYTTNNYFGSVLSGLPSQLLPIFILKILGADHVAYFAIAWTMANLLYIIPSAATQSWLAESSHNPQHIAEHMKQTIRMLSFIMVPMVMLAILIAPRLLSIFGTSYQQNSTIIFQLLALATFFLAITQIGNAISNIEKRTSGIVVSQIVSLVVGFGLAFILKGHGLAGVGVALLFGNVSSSMVQVWIHRQHIVNIVKNRRDFKNNQTLSLTAGLVAKLLRPYNLIVISFDEIQEGSRNSTVLIHTQKSKKVLRIYHPETRSNMAIKQEIEFIGFLRQEKIRTPTILNNLHNQQLSQKLIKGVTYQYILMNFEDGQHPTSYSDALLKDMAQQQAHIHIAGMRYRGIGQTGTQTGASYSRWKKVILSLISPSGYSHFDYSGVNILVTNDRVNSILDFEGMRRGPLIICLYFTLKKIYESQSDPKSIAVYVKAYSGIRKITYIERLFISVQLSIQFKTPLLLKPQILDYLTASK